MELPAFKDDCSPQRNVVFKRLQYWSHQRTAGTSVDTFITELRHKSKECEFGMSENDMLRDKLVFSITDCHLKERLLQERGLTFHRAIEICRATEQEKTPLQAMKTEHGMQEVPVDGGMKMILPDQSLHHNTRKHLDGTQEVPVDGGMKMILPDQSLHHNTRKHLGHQSVPNLDQSVKLVLAAFTPTVQLHRFQLQQPSVTDCVFSERKNVEQLLPERLHIKEEPETLSEGQEGNQLCRQQETNSAACPVKCEDDEEKPQAKQTQTQTHINMKEEPSSCTLDEFMTRQSVGMNSKGPEAARNPDPSSLVLQGPDGTETDSPHTDDRNQEEDHDDDDGDCCSWQNPVSESESNDCDSTRKKRKMSDSSENPEIRRTAAETQISSDEKVEEKRASESVQSSTACVGGKNVTLNEDSTEAGRTRGNIFQCDVCSKCFYKKANLIVHIRIHTGEKPFKCDFCSKCFREKSTLQSHIRTHTGEEPFQCVFCSKCFKRKTKLTRHIRTHTGEKPFTCDFCSKCFSRHDQLQSHIRVHTGEKPYRCDFCDKCFSQKSNLNLHVRTHTGEKPFECDVCSKSCRSQPDLNNHMKVHTV